MAAFWTVTAGKISANQSIKKDSPQILCFHLTDSFRKYVSNQYSPAATAKKKKKACQSSGHVEDAIENQQKSQDETNNSEQWFVAFL